MLYRLNIGGEEPLLVRRSIVAREGKGFSGDHTTAEDLRLTVAARAVEAKKLTMPAAEGGRRDEPTPGGKGFGC